MACLIGTAGGILAEGVGCCWYGVGDLEIGRDGGPRRLVAGLLPLLLTISPLLFEAPPKAMRAPSSAALFCGPVMSLLPMEEGARDGLLCVPAMPQRATCRSRSVKIEHRIQSSGVELDWQAKGVRAREVSAVWSGCKKQGSSPGCPATK